MNQPDNKSQQTRSGRKILLLIAAVFFGPLLIAAWMYFNGGGLAPSGRTNHGVLLEPIVNVDEELPDSSLQSLRAEHWQLLYANAGSCEADCRDSLYTIRQLRLMLGKEMDRVSRIFLHGETAPDKVFLSEEHPGLILLQDRALGQLLAAKKPAELQTGGYYLIDPYGNLVMYFTPDLEPRDIVSDIKRLLRLSHIG